jgi:hypothetical protein
MAAEIVITGSFVKSLNGSPSTVLIDGLRPTYA